MYRYDSLDKLLVRQRVAEFRDQVRRRLTGELSEDEFRPLRLMNGLYLQRHAYMLRVGIPYGLLDSDQLRALAFVAERYDRGYGHVTTRQNMQFNWVRLEQVPDILAHLAEVDMHAIQTSGNCVRNISCDPLAGIAVDELLDVRPYCELLRQYKELHPEFMFLPRKFKIALSGAERDRAAVQFHDIGAQVCRDARGELGWRVYVGGGLGRTPRLAEVLTEHLPLSHLASYLEAVLRVYNLHGRRDNKYRARIKILVGDLGIDRFRAEVEAEWAEIPSSERAFDEARLAEVAAMFRHVDYDPAAAADPWPLDRARGDAAFARWLTHNVTEHREPGYRVVHVSLKSPGRPPGDITAAQLSALAALADGFSGGYCVTTYQQNMLLPYVRVRDLVSLYDALAPLGLATANIGTVQDVICCPGLDFCDLANAESISVAADIQRRFTDPGEVDALGPLNIKMSGCINACGHHHIGHIGILGINKRGEQWYQLVLVGHPGTGADDRGAIGEILGAAVPQHAVADAVAALVDAYRAVRAPGETFLDTVRRVGRGPFQERIYGR